MSEDGKQDESKVRAEDKGIAVGSLNVSGDVSGTIHVGDTNITYQYESEEAIPLTAAEIENGLTRFAGYLPERAPVLQERFAPIAKKLRAILGAELKSLSPALQRQREDSIDEMKLMSMEVLDLSFRGLCQGQNPPSYDPRPPFLGLFAFRPEDREFYFGRETLIKKLTGSLNKYPFLAVLGASGSGKSSLVMAGLIPALEAKMAYLTPSSEPLVHLRAAQENLDENTIIVVDQFEELFTQTHDLGERERFISELLALTQTQRVVLTMRADFWGEVAPFKDLKGRMQAHQELIAPMDMDELRTAMEKQAAAVGLRFDAGLSETILEEVSEAPGAMPLLQHALWMLWKRRHGLNLKTEEYQNFGGVKQAIASTAEEVYSACADFEKERVRDIFLRLTRLDESDEMRDTRRRASIRELTPANSDPSGTVSLLDKLADARLVVKNEKEEVEVAHEALIRHWDRLVGWLHEDRDNLRLREDLSEASREWEKSGRDEILLNHRGPRLELALAMSRLPRYQLNPLEQAYLEACVDLREREKAIAARRRRFVVAGISGAFVVIIAILAAWGITNKQQVDLAQEAQAKAEIQARVARAGELGATAGRADVSSTTSMLLAIEAVQISKNAKEPVPLVAHQALLDSLFKLGGIPLSGVSGIVEPPSYTHNTIFSLKGSWLATGTWDTKIRLWDLQNLSTNPEILEWSPSSGNTYGKGITALSFSHDEHWLANGNNDGQVLVWDMTQRPTEPLIFELDNTENNIVNSLAFSPDDNWLAISGNTVKVWNIDKPNLKPKTLTGCDGLIYSLMFSENGKWLIGKCSSSKLLFWDHEEFSAQARVVTSAAEIGTIAYSADGKMAAFPDFEGVKILDLNNPESVPVLAEVSTDNARIVAINSVKHLVATVNENYVYLQDYLDPYIKPRTYWVGSSINAIAFSADGRWLASSSENGTYIWDLDNRSAFPMVLPGLISFGSIGFSPDGQWLFTDTSEVTDYLDVIVRLWDFASPATNMIALPAHSYDQEVKIIANRWLAGVSVDSSIILRDLMDPLSKFYALPSGLSITTMAVNKNETWLAAGCDPSKLGRSNSLEDCKNAKVSLWNIADSFDTVLPLDGWQGPISNLTFSSSGDQLAIGYLDLQKGSITAQIWNLDDFSYTSWQYQFNPSEKPTELAISPDMWLAALVNRGNSNFQIQLWNLNATEKMPLTLDDIEPGLLGFIPNSHWLFTGYKIWDLTNLDAGPISKFETEVNSFISGYAVSPSQEWLAIRFIEGPLTSNGYTKLINLKKQDFKPVLLRGSQETYTENLAFSSDERWLASGHYLWDLNDLKSQPLELEGVSAIEFLPDKLEIIGHYNGNVVFLKIDPDEILPLACQIVGRNFTRNEWSRYFRDEAYRKTCEQWPLESEITPTLEQAN